METGKFFTFEGVDGCGKSTQMQLFANYIFNLDKYKHVLFTREPFANRDIRRILSSDGDPYSKSEELALMYSGDRGEHAEIIEPLLNSGIWTVSDRYKLSTLAFQGAQGVDLKRLIEMQEGLLVPDITYIIDIDPRVGKLRREAGKIEEEKKFEADMDFQDKVREIYLRAKEFYPDENIYVLDGNKSIDEIFAEVKEIAHKVLGI